MAKPVYLYKIYKLIKQRASRIPENCSLPQYELRSKMSTVARTIFDGQKTKAEILKIANELKSYETKIFNIRTLFSQQIIDAVKNRNYSLEKPDHIHWRDNRDAYGYIYVFTAKSKKGRAKLGATTLDPYDRLNKYISKYGYIVDLFYYSELINDPYNLEKNIADEIEHLRVTSNIEGDSNEWYRISPTSLKSSVLKAIKDRKKYSA